MYVGRKIPPSLMVVFYFGPLPVPGTIISWSEVKILCTFGALFDFCVDHDPFFGKISKT